MFKKIPDIVEWGTVTNDWMRDLENTVTSMAGWGHGSSATHESQQETNSIEVIGAPSCGEFYKEIRSIEQTSRIVMGNAYTALR